MSLRTTGEITYIRKVGKTARMYYVSLPYGMGRELYKKKVLVKIIPLPEEETS